MKSNVKLLAFHLPQFHEIEENNQWWGKGFTEWTNVKRGRKMYPGHYQPKVPLNHNYYDLSDNDVLMKQAALAKKYGIYGFCFYHYYFTGKKLLEKPVEAYLSQKDRQPFCFAWANQSFARTWYGKNGDNEMLLRQTYGGEKEWKEHFEYLLPFFKDKQYIKVDNCPMFLIYLSQDFKNCNKMIEFWNKLALEEGFNGIHFVAMDTGFDVKYFAPAINATVDFEPMRTMRELPHWMIYLRHIRREMFLKRGVSKSALVNSFFIDNICTYDYISSLSSKRVHNNNIHKNYMGVFAGWDNTARKDESGFVIPGSRPHKFEKYLRRQIERTKEAGNEFLFINAWNEWSEGAYLEPDCKYGYAYLKAVKRALEEEKQNPSK